MKTNIFYNLLGTLALTVALTSCHDDPTIGPTVETGTGEVHLASMSVDMSNAEIVINHSGSRADVDVSDFIVTIKDQNNPAAAPYVWKFKEMPELFTLPVSDSYVVEVESHKIAKAEWDKPYFYGTKTFEIKTGEVTQIGVVEAKFSSLKVSVKFADNLRKVMGEDVEVTVKANDEGVLVYTPEETRPGYFEVVDGSTTLIAEFEGTVDGAPTTYAIPINDIAKGQHRIITYKLKNGPDIPEQSGKIDPSDGIGIDVEVESEDLTGNVVVDEDVVKNPGNPGQEGDPDEGEDNPGGEEPGGEDNPGGEEPGEDEGNIDMVSTTLSFTEANNPEDYGESAKEAKVTITAEKGIAHLLVKIESTSTEFITTLNEMNMPTTFDLAYPKDETETAILKGFEFPVGNDVVGQKSIVFDITNLAPLLTIYNGTHTFTITVEDQKGKQLSKSLVFVY